MDKTTETSVAIALNSLQKDMEYLRISVDKVNARLKEMQDSYVTKEEQKVLSDKMDVRIEGIQKDVNFIKKSGWGVIAFIIYEIGRFLIGIFEIHIK